MNVYIEYFIMRKILIFAMIALFAVTGAMAQKVRQAPDKRAEQLTKWMTKHLTLTDAQIPIVQNINYRYVVKADSLKTSKSKRKEVGKQMIEINAQKDTELQSVFTAEQFALYSKVKAERKNKNKFNKKKVKDKVNDKSKTEDIDLEESEHSF